MPEKQLKKGPLLFCSPIASWSAPLGWEVMSMIVSRRRRAQNRAESGPRVRWGERVQMTSIEGKTLLLFLTLSHLSTSTFASSGSLLEATDRRE